MAGAPTASMHGPSAPPANMFDTVPGYEGTVAGGGGYLPPPMPSVPMPVPEQAPNPPVWQTVTCVSGKWKKTPVPPVLELEICSSCKRQRLFSLLGENPTCRWAKGKLLVFIQPQWLQCCLVAKRTMSFSLCLSLSGQPVDAGVQPAPGPWQIAAQPPAFFQEHKQTIKVPYTSSVKV
ncbi:hypothetical protein cypCar_00042666 [Cyprinus carpio]|nr:hypothetical protein cypCar_00042666 [Cyprinus carpio]